MNIVFVSHSPGTGGAEHSLATLIETALGRGHEATVSLPHAPEHKIRDLLPPPERIRIVTDRWVRMMQGHRPRLSGPLRLVVGLLDAARFARKLRLLGADIVVVNSTTIPQASLAARMAGLPAVTMVREAIRTNPALPSFLPKGAIAWLIRKQSTATIAVSEYVSNQIGTATHVVYPQVPHCNGMPSGRTSDTSLRLAMAGTLSAEKGQADAVRAVKIAIDEGADVRLDLYGQAEPGRLERLHALVGELGLEDYVRHRGETREMMAIFAEADLSIVCSRNEAFGRVTAESISAGTPVIGYACGGTREILERGGGLLCSAQPSALASHIVRLAGDRAELDSLRTSCAEIAVNGGVGGAASDVIDIIEDEGL